MANEEHVAILRQGIERWNKWLQENRYIQPDLAWADLHGANLEEACLVRAILWEANLQGANLQGADLAWAKLTRANLQGADLRGASLQEADLQRANLQGANLSEADLIRANLSEADFSRANLCGADIMEARLNGANLSDAVLIGANLRGSSLVQTTVHNTIFTRCNVYGLSVWNITGTPKDQSGLIITPYDAHGVTVDDLEVAQFIYLLLNREKLRNIITTITSKAVLILGRFTPERKAFLDAMADELRKHNLLPIIFDFEGAMTRDVTETIKTLAGLSLFVIADITNPKSAPLELQATVPDYQIPFVAIIQEGERPFSMFSDLPKYPWVLTPVIEYSSVEKLLHGFKQGIIDRAWAKHQELVKQKNKTIETQSIEDFVREDEG